MNRELAALDLAQPWSVWAERAGLMGPKDIPYRAVMLSGDLEAGDSHCLEVINHDGICIVKRYEHDGSALQEVVLADDADKLDFLSLVGGWLGGDAVCETALSKLLVFSVVPVRLESYINPTIAANPSSQ